MFTHHKLQGAGGAGGETYWAVISNSYKGDYYPFVSVNSSGNILWRIFSGTSVCYYHLLNKNGDTSWVRSQTTAFAAWSGPVGPILLNDDDTSVHAYAYSAGGGQFWPEINRLSSSGTTTYTNKWSVSTTDLLYNVISPAPSGGYAMCFIDNSTGYGGWTVRDSSNSLVATKRLNVVASASSIIWDGGSYYYATLMNYTTGSWLFKLDTSLGIVWQRKLSNVYRAMNVVYANSSVYVGFYNTSGYHGYAKFDTSGTLLTSNSVKRSGVNSWQHQSIAVDSSGNVYSACRLEPTYKQTSLVKFNDSGTVLWKKYFYNASKHMGTPYVTINNKGTPILAMADSATTSVKASIWKLPPDGNFNGTYGDYTVADEGSVLETGVSAPTTPTDSFATPTYTDRGAGNSTGSSSHSITSYDL